MFREADEKETLSLSLFKPSSIHHPAASPTSFCTVTRMLGNKTREPQQISPKKKRVRSTCHIIYLGCKEKKPGRLVGKRLKYRPVLYIYCIYCDTIVCDAGCEAVFIERNQ